MNSEKELIKLIAGFMPRNVSQLNGLFEADCEIIDFKGGRMLFNIDEFSCEDYMRDGEPYTLGWNVAVGSISDILASGGQPLFYLHSMTVGEDWGEEYIKNFSKGVSDVLKRFNTAFLGGDFGRSKDWRYTATVIGTIEGEPVLRSGASVGDKIYITGKIGAGNLEAFLKLYEDKKVLGKIAGKVKTHFKLRLEEAQLIKKYASCCIDTSDGVFNAVKAIAEMSGTGYELYNLPYTGLGVMAAKLTGMPTALLFLGECGEYELLFTVGAKKEKDFLKEAEEKGFEFFEIGKIAQASSKVLIEDKSIRNLESLDISARCYSDMKQYINELVRRWHSL